MLQILDSYDILPDNILMVTADVTALYTNIPHEEGLQATTHHYNTFPHLLPAGAPNVTILSILLDFILKNSNFRFQEQHYLQNSGTSMGGRYAPQYANLFMGTIEDMILTEFQPYILLWKRFIDDIFFLFSGSQEDFNRLTNFMNSIHDTIKFTFESSTFNINFLDISILFKNHKFHSSIYRKPTDRSQLLHYQSNHPHHVKEGIVYSQGLRYNLIISNDPDLKKELYHLTKIFIARGYPLQTINRNLVKALQIPREQLLNNNQPPPPARQMLPLILYNNKDNNIRKTIYEKWTIIEEDPILNTILPKPITVYRNNTTLGTILTSTDVKPHPNI
ncbi:uncharacterized protein [Clytia hemisphaerica]|uniref:uncharacterized protein n=1 Tax=Clytia hemisphaerica TaxID=252671 RepID=UPI0034D7399C